jgi:ubiquitin C-terminal hydrolase
MMEPESNDIIVAIDQPNVVAIDQPIIDDSNCSQDAVQSFPKQERGNETLDKLPEILDLDEEMLFKRPSNKDLDKNNHSDIPSILRPKRLDNDASRLSLENTKMIITNNREDIQKRIITRGLSGLQNFGATCYMNAAIQVLSATRPILSYMIHQKSALYNHLEENIIRNMVEKNEKDKKDDPRVETLTITQSDIESRVKKTLAYKLRITMKYMWAKNEKICPKQLKRYVDKNLTYFKEKFHQHDAHEFLMALIDNIYETTKSPAKRYFKFEGDELKIENEMGKLQASLIKERGAKNHPGIKAVIDEIDNLCKRDFKTYLKVRFVMAWDPFMEKSYSVINDIFSGMSWTTNTCKTCLKSKHHFERFDSLHLHLPGLLDVKREKYTLDELMANYISTEDMVGNNQAYCEYCNAGTNSSKKISIYQQPNTLIILFKKYQHYNGSLIKSNIKIEYDHFFDMKPYLSEYTEGITKYELYAVIRHSGGLGGGHYYSYCKNPINGLWYRFDDQSIYGVDPSEPLRCNGYVLLYRQ